MDGAIIVGAYRERGSYALAVDDDGGLGCLARHYRLGVGVVGVLDLAEVSALDGSGALFLRAAVSVLDLDKLGTGCSLAVDEVVNLDLVAVSIKTVVAVGYVREEGRVEPAAAWACNASSCGGVEGWVFLVEGCVGKGKIKVVLYPRRYMLRG